MDELLSLAKSTAQQVTQWWDQLTESNESVPVTRLVTECWQRWRRELDRVIVTRLPQFRDVVEETPEPEEAAGDTDGSSASACLEEPTAEADAALFDRRREAAQVIDNHSWLAAANALNPILGLDIKIDLTIFASLARSVGAVYNLSEEQVQALQDRSEAQLSEESDTFHHLARRLAPFVTSRASALALRRIGLELAAREATKWVPAIGSVVAASIGYCMISRTGEQLREECEEAARATFSGPVTSRRAG
jgi:hypothetical protein